MVPDDAARPAADPSGAEAGRPVVKPRLRRRSLLIGLLTIYLVLLGISHVVRRAGGTIDDERRRPSMPSIELAAVDGERMTEQRVRLVYSDSDPTAEAGRSTVLLLHGSPGSSADFATVAPVLAQDRRVLVPDLPGFGDSARDVDDYSIRAHARYALQLLDRLGVERAHVVGFSMGGGVALNLYDLAPTRVASVTLLSAIGVQELELFGDYQINHSLHGVQLWLVLLLREAVPHMGALDDAFFGVPYARNFYDSDQRPLRGVLERFAPPMLIIHGERDFLVPVAAAEEHRRVVPQSELRLLPASHFVTFVDGPRIGRLIEEFLARVDAGRAADRTSASPSRLLAAARPFDVSAVPPYSGMALVIITLLIVVFTFLTEDFACIAAGLLVAQGRIEFTTALVGCFVGIFVGDVLLFFAGRYLGRPALRRAPFRWFLDEDRVELASRWFDERGPWMIGISRFIPGTRLPTYFTAGMLHTNLFWIGLYFVIATLVWTPLLVGAAAVIGERAFAYLDLVQRNALWALLALAVLILFVAHIVIPSFTFHGRRRLVARWRRARRWEFWPPWLFYPPVVLYVVWLGLKHRNPLVFTAANPAIEAGGFIAESKYRILQSLRGAGSAVARARLLPERDSPAARLEAAKRFVEEQALDWPVVLKPDAGQRGSGVAVVRDEQALASYLAAADFDVLVQEYVPGHELGVFYYRYPGEPHGRIFSITDKRMPYVTGNGRDTLERLILLDGRAVCMAEHYLAARADQLFCVPAEGERVRLVELGTHCRGAVFLDGRRFITPDLEREIERISRTFDGFFFGRYDLRGDLGEIERGRGFKVIELNGVTSEATHIYDPARSLFGAYAILFRQWSIAFEIGRRNHDSGVPVASLRLLIDSIKRYRRLSRSHPG